MHRTLICTLLIGSTAHATGIGDPNFENTAPDNNKWLVSCNLPAAPPIILPDYDNDCEATGGHAGTQGFRVGRTGGKDGCTGGVVLQRDWVCTGPDEDWCTITFRAKFASNDGEVANVAFINHTTGAFTIATIPVSAAFKTYKISAEGCRDQMGLAFSVDEAAAAPTARIQSVLCVDEITCTCTDDNETNMGEGIDKLKNVKKIPAPSPCPPDTPSMPETALPPDCNDNQQSDQDDIEQGILNGTTHACIGQEADCVGVVEHLRADDHVFSNH